MSAHAALLDDVAERPHVDAALQYQGKVSGPLYNYTFDPPAGVERTNVVSEAHVVPVYDARVAAPDAALDREGTDVLPRESIEMRALVFG